MVNHYLKHLLPQKPDYVMGLMPTAEDWEDYANAVEAILVALPVLRADVIDPAVARTKAKEARARGEVRKLPSTSPGPEVPTG
jgi:hypothetical protein